MRCGRQAGTLIGQTLYCGPVADAPESGSLWRAVRSLPDFWRLLELRTASQLGDGLFQAGLAGGLLFNPERAASPWAVAGAFAVLFLPYSLLGPFAGALLDRWDRRAVLIGANAARVVLVLGVAALLAAGARDLFVLCGALTVNGFSRFVTSGLSAALPDVVPREQVVTMNSVATAVGATAAFLGANLMLVPRWLFGAGDGGAASVIVLVALPAAIALPAAPTADNAAALAELAPAGIDLNFGCPAKTVNQHRGGAVLLDEPELIGRIVAAVRRAVPAHIPVSAKMRLGFNDDRRAEDCAQAIEAAGASDLVVHARTKAHGYRPPAYWERVADLRQHVRLPMVANGEIWTLSDALRCRLVTGCERLMIGRGMVADPGLALAIAQHDASAKGGGIGAPVSWSQILELMRLFWQGISLRVAPRHRAGRLKQWLNYLRRVYPEAQQAFESGSDKSIDEEAGRVRDFVGYGRNPPDPRWPGGARDLTADAGHRGRPAVRAHSRWSHRGRGGMARVMHCRSA